MMKIHLSCIVNGEPVELPRGQRNESARGVARRSPADRHETRVRARRMRRVCRPLDGQPVLSCPRLGAEASDARQITTVEGLAQDGRLHPLQECFADLGAAQCGYCTPGILVTAKALLDQEPHPSRERICEALSGNLCRCTGYLQIVEAVEAAARMIPSAAKHDDRPRTLRGRSPATAGGRTRQGYRSDAFRRRYPAAAHDPLPAAAFNATSRPDCPRGHHQGHASRRRSPRVDR